MKKNFRKIKSIYMIKNVISGMLILASVSGFAQVQTQIIGDSVRIHSNTGTGELILENSTKTVNGYLYNKGNGRTEFRRGLTKVNDSVYIIGGDTLNLYTYASGNGWKITGNGGTTPASHFLGTIDSTRFIMKTNNKQRMSVWADGTVNIAPDDTTTKPVFRFYPNGDFAASSTNDYITNQFNHKNGLRFNKKLGILEIGISNNLDTSLNISQDEFQTSALIVNSDSHNTINGMLISSIISGDSISINTGSQVNWSIISGERHSINGVLAKSNVLGYGNYMGTRDYQAYLISGISNRVDSSGNSMFISGFANQDLDSSYSSIISGGFNRFSGNAQLVSGGNLIARGFGATTLGLANVDFSSLTPVKLTQPANLQNYPVLAIGNSSAYLSHRSNALTMLYSGRTQINTTGYDSTLTQSQVTPKAALEVVSTNSGVLLPKLTTTQRDNIISGDLHNGLLLYNTDSSKFQFYNGSGWVSLTDAGVTPGITVNVTPVSSGTSGRIFFQNSSNQVSQSSRFTWSDSDSTLTVAGALKLTGTGTTNFITPVGSSAPTKINVPVYDPGSFGQVAIMGIPSSAPSSARVLSLIDARTSAHQPSFGVFDPTESDIVGFSWDGEEGVAAIKSMGSNFVFRKNTTDIVYINSISLNTGFGGNTEPTAKVHMAAGTSSANTAPLKFNPGTNLSTPEDGAVEFNGTNYFVTSGTTRYTLAKTFTATSTLDFGSTAAQNSTDLTITVTGAADGDAVSVGAPNAAINANSCYTAWVSAADTVTVRFNNYSSGSINPASGTFRVSVTKY